MWSLELGDDSESGACASCDKPVAHTRGSVQYRDAMCLEYLIAWHRDEPTEPSAWCHVIADEWADPASPRSVVYFSYGLVEDGHAAFTVKDADCDFVRAMFPGHRYVARNEVMGTQMAEELFQITDFIWLNDDRVAPIVAWAESVNGAEG
jgi:hypothetical protein